MLSSEKEILENLHPQRNTFTFDNGLIISSDFDSGNLWKCHKALNSQITQNSIESQAEAINRFIEEDSKEQAQSSIEELKAIEAQNIENMKGIEDYELWICPDSHPYSEENSYRTWFFFSVTNFPKDLKTLRFTVRNMSNQGKLIGYGLKPVYIEFTQPEHQKFISQKQIMFRQPWKRVKPKVDHLKGEEGMQMYFQHTLKPDQQLKDVLYFAFTYPYSFEDITRSINEVQIKSQKREEGELFFHRQVLIKSIENRDIELITLSSKEKMLEEKEPQIQDENLIKQDPDNLPNLFEKPCIFVTSRVHCGETPGSYMLQGMLDLLMDFNNPYSKLLLDNFVFKIIPCLNPDGVARGYWRNDTRGDNLNRHYSDPNPLDQPSIYATIKAIQHASQNCKLKYYTDLHGHASKRGCFVFGNSIPDHNQNVEQILLAKLMSMNCINFDLQESNFSDEANNKKDGKGMGRDASGRAATFRVSKLPHCFTMECNYATGVRNNTLKPRLDLKNRSILKKEDSHITDITSAYYRAGGSYKSPVFDSEVFKDVGRAYLISILDLEKLNPLPRILKNFDETFDCALDRLRSDINKDLKKPKNLFKSKKGNGGGFRPEFEIIIASKKCVQETIIEETKFEESKNEPSNIQSIVTVLDQQQVAIVQLQKCQDDFDLIEKADIQKEFEKLNINSHNDDEESSQAQSDSNSNLNSNNSSHQRSSSVQ